MTDAARHLDCMLTAMAAWIRHAHCELPATRRFQTANDINASVRTAGRRRHPPIDVVFMTHIK